MPQPMLQQRMMSAQGAQLAFTHLRQAKHKYDAICTSSGRDAALAVWLPEVKAALRAALVLVHEAMLYKSATQPNYAKLSCTKTLLLIMKRDVRTDILPLLYDVAKTISIS